MRRRGIKTFAAIGVPTLTTVLVVLLLCTFSVLSYLSAQADLRLSRQAAAAASDYWAADGAATARMEEIDALLARGDWDAVRAAGVTVEGGRAAWRTPVGERGALYVEIDVSGGRAGSILAWRTEAE